jgi:hypothetical protein
VLCEGQASQDPRSRQITVPDRATARRDPEIRPESEKRACNGPP